MSDPDLASTIGSAIGGGAVAGALLLIVYRIASRVAERLIAAIDRIAAAVSEHTKVDLQHHSDVRQAVVRVEAKLDTMLDEHERERTPVDGIVRPAAQKDPPSERRRRARTPLQQPGYRPPRPPPHNDE